ncbi:MAG: hypothetical protein IJV76_06425 [Clostridia bacterium]|nr:hypothetical protein [Clostridia bacterium]
MADNHEKSGLEHTAQAAGAVRGAMKAGKALAGASKGAAFGPYGMAAGLAWEGRKVIGKVILAVIAFLLLPVVLLMMLPGALFGGSDADDPLNPGTENAVWDESAVEEILFDDYGAVSETFTDACDAVDDVMQSAYEQVLMDIRIDFASYGEGYTMMLTDPYTEELLHDSTRIICEYSVLTDMEEELNITELTKKLSRYKENFFFYMVVENGTEIEYTVIYLGDEYITEDIFGLTEEQTELAADLADSLKLYIEEGEDDGTTD